MRVYIIKGNATRNNLDDISHQGYLMGYAATTGVILYWKLDQPFVIHRAHHIWFHEYNYIIYIKERKVQVLYSFDKILKVMFIINTSST